MKRRDFLASTAKAGAAAVLALSPAGQVLANATEARRVRLWYASHCYGCGFAYPEPFLAGLAEAPTYLLCEFCKWHVMPTQAADDPMAVPPDWQPRELGSTEVERFKGDFPERGSIQ